MKKPVLFALLSFAVLFAFSGCNEDQAKVLAPSQNVPLVDGIIENQEYSVDYDFDDLKLSLSRSGDRVCLALSSTYPGWAAIGVGSNRMNNATLFIGYVVGGEAFFTEQKGTGHRHAENAFKDHVATASAITEKAGVVTLEVECPAAAVIPVGAKEFPVLIAASDQDSFTGYHSARREVTVKIE